MNLKEFSVVDNGVDDVFHIISLVGVLRNDGIEAVLETVDRILGGHIGSLLEIVGGDIADDITDELESLLLSLADEMGNARFSGVNHSTAKLIGSDILAGNGLHNLRTSEEHIAVLFRHKDEVGQSR